MPVVEVVLSIALAYTWVSLLPVVEAVLSIDLAYTWCYCASRRGCPVHCSGLHLGVIVPVVREIGFLVMVFNPTVNNISVISWRSVLLMEETGVHRENH